MNSDTSTEMIVPANVSWPYLIRKNFTRDIPTTLNNYISIGNWVVSNGAAYFEVSVQVNTSGFTISKSYRFSVKSNATANTWQKIVPEVDSGTSGSNDFDFLINSDGSIVSFRLKRSGGSTPGEAKIYISKYGNPDDVFSSSVVTGSVTVTNNYPRSLGLNSVFLTEANIFTADQTVNAKFIAKGDGVNFPSARIGAGTSGLSANSSVNGSLILQGATGGAKSQFEIISPTGSYRIILESDSVNGSSLYSQGGDLKFNSASVSQVYYGTNSAKGVMFAAGLTGSTDIGISRVSSGVLKVNDGAAGYGSISSRSLRVNSIDTSKTQAIYASGTHAYIENTSGNPVGFICNRGSGVAAAFTAGADRSTISYDVLGSFAIAAQSNALVKDSPGTGTINYRLWINTNGDLGVNTTLPTQKLDVNGNIKGTNFYGNGFNLTNINSNNIVGTISGSQLPNPSTGVLGGVKSNGGSLGQFVSGISSDGSLLYGLVNSSSAKTIAVLSPKEYEAPIAGYTANLSSRNGRPILNFSHDTGQSALWTSMIPYDANLKSGLSVNVWWSCQVGLGDVGWQFYLERVNENSIISDDRFIGPYTIAASSVPTTGRIKKTSLVLNSGQLSGISQGEIFRTKLLRNIAVDDAAGVAEFHKMEIRTENVF
jgi:hypothetical protein